MRASPDDILGMAFFARVVEARSFSVAARALGVSKSAVSARVSRLEARLGVRLLHRSTRRLSLTADGVRLYEGCARVAAAADETAELGAETSASPRGLIRVHASPAFAQMHLLAPIRAFMDANAEVHVELRLGDRVPDLEADGIDVSIVIARRLSDSVLLARKLSTTRVVTCASPSYLRRHGIPFRPQELVLHECLAHSIAQYEDWQFETEEGPVAMRAVARMIVDERGFLREAAVDGQGIVMLPGALVARELADGRLVRVLDEFQQIDLTVHALHPPRRHVPASVRAFLDHLTESFRSAPWERSSRAALRTRPARRARGRAVTITEQDVRRLEAVADLYEEIDPDGVSALRGALARSKTVRASKLPASTVTMRSRVACADESGDLRELTLAYPWEAGGDRVSVLGGSGAALLGASVGATLRHEGRTLKIVRVAYQPEAAGDQHL